RRDGKLSQCARLHRCSPCGARSVAGAIGGGVVPDFLGSLSTLLFPIKHALVLERHGAEVEEGIAEWSCGPAIGVGRAGHADARSAGATAVDVLLVAVSTTVRAAREHAQMCVADVARAVSVGAARRAGAAIHASATAVDVRLGAVL